jgi:arsenite-transporting ATPase
MLTDGYQQAMRLIFYLGKGGTGKTTVAAATALRCAAIGHRTLVISTDIAHSLADVLDQPLEAHPTQVAENLWGQEINVIEEVRAQWGELQEFVETMLRRRGMSQVIAEELAIVPGMEEIASLLNVYKHCQEAKYDVIVVDAAPTGETIRLLAVPETFQWYLGRFDQKGDQIWRLAQIFGLISTQEMFDILTQLDADVTDLRKILTDPKVSSYRVVINPEKMVIRESQRAVTYLNLYGYPVDLGIINRVLPDKPSSDPYLRPIQEIQGRYLTMLYDTFSPLPLYKVPWYNKEIIGVEPLQKMAGDLWGDEDPTQIFWQGPTFVVEERDHELILQIPLPHVEIEKINMIKRGDELFVSVGNFKREIILPNSLAVRKATSAELNAQGILEIRFIQPD